MPGPPTRPRLRARYESRRREIVDAAAKVFAQRGYHATSIDDLIAETGITRGGIYHYTASKQELLLSVVAELMDPLLAEAQRIVEVERIVEASGTAESRLRELMRLWLEHVARHRDHMIVFSQERSTLERLRGWAKVRDARRRFEQMLSDLLESGRRDGSFDIDDPQIALLMLLGAVNHVPQWLRSGGRLSPVEIADRYSDLLLDGIRAR